MGRLIDINGERLWSRLNQVGAVGTDARGGINRFAWEPSYKEAVKMMTGWIEKEGLSYRIDTVGNVYARLEGEEPGEQTVLSGSHFDTVPQGGYFDGLAGVMGALESLVAIKESGIPHKRPIEMVAFINEEASQFLGGTFGSKAMCGMLPHDYAYQLRHRRTNQLLSDAMKEYGFGLDPDNIEGSIINPKAYYAFIEMHIEQGRYLLDKDIPLSVVQSVAGIKQFYITINGEAAHAGGMAMKDRHDAMAAAAAITTEVERLAHTISADARGTVGYIETHPGEHNIIAEKCIMPVDFREADLEKWKKMYDDLMLFTARECEKRGLTWSVHYTCNLEPAPCREELRQLMDNTADKLNIVHNSMISFPAHDAMNISRIMPMGMIFLRSSNGGVSHCPEEFTTKEDMVKGTRLLANTLLQMAAVDIL